MQHDMLSARDAMGVSLRAAVEASGLAGGADVEDAIAEAALSKSEVDHYVEIHMEQVSKVGGCMLLGDARRAGEGMGYAGRFLWRK